MEPPLAFDVVGHALLAIIRQPTEAVANHVLAVIVLLLLLLSLIHIDLCKENAVMTLGLIRLAYLHV